MAGQVGTLVDTTPAFKWQQDMFDELASGSVHQFILHFSVFDYVFEAQKAVNPDYRPMRLRDYLGALFCAKGFPVVLYYSATRGLQLMDPQTMQPLLDAVESNARKAGRAASTGSDPDQHTGGEVSRELTRIEGLLEASSPERAGQRIALIIGNLDAIAPRDGAVSTLAPEQNTVEILHRVAFSLNIRRKGHVVVMLTSNLDLVHPMLRTATSECRTYRIDLPDTDERLAFLQWLRKRCQLAGIDPLAYEGSFKNLETLAAQTAGFNFDNLRDLMYFGTRQSDGVSQELVRRRKRDVISAESRDLLEFVEPTHTLDDVAGYAYVCDHLRQLKGLMSNRALSHLAPKGILFLGPPGTGKTYTVVGLARETGFNLVKFKNIRSMWVGESERNLNRVLDLLRSLHPAIVFIDEIDQAIGRRSARKSDSSGVDRRIFQRLLEVMADDQHRGRVLWMAASNRPDLVDQALISRFDVVIPYLLPDRTARCIMLDEIYPRKLGYEMSWQESYELDRAVDLTEGYSGRELDTICRHICFLTALSTEGDAVKISSKVLFDALETFRPAHDDDEYLLFSLLAIKATNFTRFLPDWESLPAEIRSSDPSSGHVVDEDKLQAAIQRLLEGRARTRMIL